MVEELADGDAVAAREIGHPLRDLVVERERAVLGEREDNRRATSDRRLPGTDVMVEIGPSRIPGKLKIVKLWIGDAPP